MPAGCASTPRVEPQPSEIALPAPDSRILRACATPTAGWAEADTQEQQEALIRRDRRALRECHDRHAAAVKWIADIVALFDADPETPDPE